MKNILFLIEASPNWLGGAYYAKNIIYSLLAYEKAQQSFNIYILVKEEYYSIVESFKETKNVTILIWRKSNICVKGFKVLFNRSIGKLCGRSIVPEVYPAVLKYKIDYIYPLNLEYIRPLFIYKKSISWIPDFQHVYFPEYFSEKEIQRRNRQFLLIAKMHNKLVLSSEAAYNDYKKLYPLYLKDVYIVPFASALDRSIIEKNLIEENIKKYKLNSKYYVVSNQFWKHKNYLLLFGAMWECISEFHQEIYVVCTGKMDCYDNSEYIDCLKQYIHEHKLENNIRLLDIIPREDQLQLMKGSIAVIQPSLFEGWGTVVEDAKALGKPIILSDIDVHYEQKNEECLVFDKHDSHQLAEIMVEFWNRTELKVHTVDKNYAAEYGKKMFEVLAH